MNEILMEGMRLQDELQRRQTEAKKSLKLEDGDTQAKTSLKITLNEEDTMALEKHLQGLKEVKGFRQRGL